MKISSVLLSLPLAALAAPAEQVQDAQLAVLAAAPDPKALNFDCTPKEQLSPVMRKNAQRKFFSFGPLTLKPNQNGAEGGHSHEGGGMGGKSGGMGGMGGMGGEGDNQGFHYTVPASRLCAKGKPCTVLSGQIKISDGTGKLLNVTNGLYVHHILTTGRPSLTGAFVNNPMAMMGPGFVGAGDDNGNTPFIYTPRDGSIDSGYLLKPTDDFTAEIMLVNYNKKELKVCVNYDLEYMDGSFGTPVKSSLLSAAMRIKTSRTGAINTTSSAMKFKESGSIILAKGHMHDGGSAMYLDLYKASDTANRNPYFSCASKAEYGGQIVGGTTETITNVSDCNKKPIKVQNGDKMIMKSEYDLKSHPLRETSGGGEAGVMGMFRIIFVPTA